MKKQDRFTNMNEACMTYPERGWLGGRAPGRPGRPRAPRTAKAITNMGDELALARWVRRRVSPRTKDPRLIRLRKMAVNMLNEQGVPLASLAAWVQDNHPHLWVEWRMSQ